MSCGIFGSGDSWYGSILKSAHSLHVARRPKFSLPGKKVDDRLVRVGPVLEIPHLEIPGVVQLVDGRVAHILQLIVRDE